MEKINIPDQSIFQLKGKIQHYVWGGYTYIPQLLQLDSPEDQPYAELWMGAHSKAPSEVVVNGSTVQLDQLISIDPTRLLGEQIANRFQNRLPYLFKVLDVKDMLSIQVHPSKKEAEKGFERENQAGIPITAKHRNYRDDNHKPEIMVALTDFWLLHGFRKENEVEQILETIPEFETLKPYWEKGKYLGLYKYIMEIPQKDVNLILKSLADRIVPAYRNNQLKKHNPDFWAARAIENSVLPEGDYDRGIFSIYLFNLVYVGEGEGIFQDAGIPHAYLEGVNIELMANSDNVLRGGLTPKHIDVPELLKHVVFEVVEPHVLKGEEISNTEKIYKNPAQDFQLSRIFVDAEHVHKQDATHSADIVIIIDGEVNVSSSKSQLLLRGGEIFFAPASVDYQISANQPASMFKATVPLIG